MEEGTLMKAALAASLLGVIVLFIAASAPAKEKQAYLSGLSEEGELLRINASIRGIIPKKSFFLVQFSGCGSSEARVYSKKIPELPENSTAEITLRNQNGILVIEEIQKNMR